MVVPSFSVSFVETEMLELASEVTGVAYQVVEEDAWPLTLVAKGVEECLMEGNHWMVAVERVVVEDDPLEDLVLTGVAVVVRPFHDASRDVEDDEWFDELLRLNLELAVALKVAHRRTIDEAYPLD